MHNLICFPFICFHFHALVILPIQRMLKMATPSKKRIDCPRKILLKLAELQNAFSTGKSVHCEKFHSMEDETITNMRSFALLWIIDKETPELHDIAKEKFDKFDDEVKNFGESAVGKMFLNAMHSSEGMSVAQLTSAISDMKEVGCIGIEEFTNEFEKLLEDKEAEEEREEPGTANQKIPFSDEIKFCAPKPYGFYKIYDWMAENSALRKIVKDFVRNLAEEELRKLEEKFRSSNSTDQLMGLLKEEVDVSDPETVSKAIRDKYYKCLQNP